MSQNHTRIEVAQGHTRASRDPSVDAGEVLADYLIEASERTGIGLEVLLAATARELGTRQISFDPHRAAALLLQALPTPRVATGWNIRAGGLGPEGMPYSCRMAAAHVYAQDVAYIVLWRSDTDSDRWEAMVAVEGLYTPDGVVIRSSVITAPAVSIGFFTSAQESAAACDAYLREHGWVLLSPHEPPEPL